MINIIRIDEKSYKNILIYYIGYVTVKVLRYVKINSVTPWYLIINKINGHIEESIGNKNLMLVPTDGSKDTLKKYEELWNKIRDLINLINLIKIKFNLNNDLLLNKTLEPSNMRIVATSVFHERSKYYPQVFLDECLYELRII